MGAERRALSSPCCHVEPSIRMLPSAGAQTTQDHWCQVLPAGRVDSQHAARIPRRSQPRRGCAQALRFVGASAQQFLPIENSRACHIQFSVDCGIGGAPTISSLRVRIIHGACCAFFIVAVHLKTNSSVQMMTQCFNRCLSRITEKRTDDFLLHVSVVDRTHDAFLIIRRRCRPEMSPGT